MSAVDSDPNSTAVYDKLNEFDDKFYVDLDEESPMRNPSSVRLSNKGEKEMTQDEQAEVDANAKMLLISFLAMVLVGFGNKVTQTFYPIALSNYILFVSLFTTLVYIPTSAAYIIPMIKWGNAITAEQRTIPLTKFAVMGGLDAIAGIMQVMANVYIVRVSAGLVILLPQSAIPISMIISRMVLGTRYRLSQFVGAGIVAVGLAIVLVPYFLQGGDDEGHTNTTQLIIWSTVMILSAVPMTLSSVYKEQALGEMEIDAVYLNGWIAVFQFLFSIPALIPSAWAIALPLDEIWSNLWNGWECYAYGTNFITDCSEDALENGTCFNDHCGKAFWYLTIYIIFNIGYNILIILILKFGSSNLLWLAMTVMVPLGNLAFAIPGMPNYAPLRVTDVLGLCVLMGGLIGYRFWTKLSAALFGTTNKTLQVGEFQSVPDSEGGLGNNSPKVFTPGLGGDAKHTAKRHKAQRQADYEAEQAEEVDGYNKSSRAQGSNM